MDKKNWNKVDPEKIEDYNLEEITEIVKFLQEENRKLREYAKKCKRWFHWYLKEGSDLPPEDEEELLKGEE